MLYARETIPFTSILTEGIDVTQRKMLRNIIGWKHNTTDTWDVIGNKMKQRYTYAMQIYPIKDWSVTVLHRKSALRQ